MCGVRKVNLVPNSKWGGRGILGCSLLSGALHRIPKDKLGKASSSHPSMPSELSSLLSLETIVEKSVSQEETPYSPIKNDVLDFSNKEEEKSQPVIWTQEVKLEENKKQPVIK